MNPDFNDRSKSLISIPAFLLAAAVLLALTTGCAKVGEPLPPLVIVPDTISDFRLVEEGNERLHFLFRIPSARIRRIEIDSACGPDASLAKWKAFAADQIQATALGGLKKISLDLPAPAGCRYALRFLDESGRRSDFSNVVATSRLAPASPPTDLEAVASETAIRLQWQPPSENLDGSTPPNREAYLVNWEFLVSSTVFEDRDFEFGESKSYRVQTVSQSGNPMVLSAPSDPLTVKVEDRFAPDSPDGLEAIPLRQAVQLIWNPVPAEDLAGYRVYRRQDGGGFQKLSPLVSINRYLDQPVPGGVALEYFVTAQDKAGNESAASEPVNARISTEENEQ